MKLKNQMTLENHELTTKSVLQKRILKQAEESAKISKAKHRGIVLNTLEELE